MTEDPRTYLTGVLDQLAAAKAKGDTSAADAILARLIDDNIPAARAVIADALRLAAASGPAPDTEPPSDSIPDIH